VFFSHNKPAPASSNQPRNPPANRPMVSICKDAAYASATADETEENVQQLQM